MERLFSGRRAARSQRDVVVCVSSTQRNSNEPLPRSRTGSMSELFYRIKHNVLFTFPHAAVCSPSYYFSIIGAETDEKSTLN